MSPLFERKKVMPSTAESSMRYVSAATAIHATRRQVWEFIKPPENSVLMDPDIVRGFTAPGIEGAGEVQVFISIRDGLERVSALEVMEEIPQELAITRTLGGEDPAARGRTSLRDGDGGALYCRQYVERVKAFLERQPGYPAG